MDIARLGFSVPTDPLDKAVDALNRLAPAAGRAESAVDNLARGANGMSAGVARLAEGYDVLTGKINRNFLAISKNMQTWDRVPVSLGKVPAAANAAASSLDRLGRAASDNINRMQATPGNIAAQFQDIGVTAAGGMSPMLIALQQGTQLSAALAGGLGNLGAAFKQLFGFTTLLTIGFVALIAAAIQMVDWSKAAAGAMEWLADVMVEAAPYAVALAAGLLLINAPAILTGVVALTKAMYGLAAGLLAAVGIPALIVIGLVAIVAAAVHFRKELTEILGFDIVQAAQDGVNSIIGFFVGGYNGVKAVWSKLPSALGDLTIQAANATLAAIDRMVNGAINRINGLMKQLPFGVGDGLQMGNVEFGQQANPYAGAAAGVAQIATEAVRAAQKVDYVGIGIRKVRDYAKQGAAYLRSWAKDLQAGDPDKAKKDKADKDPKGGKTEAEKWADLIKAADGQMRGLEQAGAQIGVYGEALSRLKFEQELFNKAQDAGITLTDKMTAELKRRAGEMAAQEAKNTHDTFVEGLIQSGDAQSRALDMQRTALGLTGQALDSYTYSQTILNDALNKHIALSPAEIAAIKEMGDNYAAGKAQVDAMTEALKRQAEQLKFVKETIKGVFTEWVNNVRNGQSVFGAFADSVLNALNKIIDKALDMALNGALDAIFGGASSGAGGGLFSSLLSGIGGGLSSNSQAAAAGGSYDFSPVAFAKGGIVDNPTMFKFAKGTGLMGEAGPEAIMPLKRGADGALGVQMHDGGRGASQAPSVTIAGSTYNVGGVTTPAEIMAAIRQGDEQAKAELARAIPALLSEYQRNGTTG